jgi:uncharacterized repeat protein (TIGR01451 family)
VITAWSFQADASPPLPTSQFIVGRRCSSSSPSCYTTVGAAEAGAITANQLNDYPVRIPVHAGDVIGLSAGDGDFYWNSGPTGDEVAEGPSGVTVGSAATYSTQQFQKEGLDTGGSRLDVAAQVEPDADGDGFGDVSQDACPGVPGSVQGCPQADLAVTQSASAGTVPLGGLVTYRLEAVNHGPEAAPSVVLTDSLPAAATLISATSSGGACSFGTTVRCDLGTLASGASADVAVTVRLNSAGTAVSAARVNSVVLDSAHARVPAAGDTNPANDTVTTDVAVTPPLSTTPGGGRRLPLFGGVTWAAHAIKLSGRNVLVPLRSALTSKGTLTLTTLVRHRTVVIGRAPFALAAGKTKQIRVRLSGQALSLLGRHHVLEAVGMAIATDAFGTRRTTRARLSLQTRTKKPKPHR